MIDRHDQQKNIRKSIKTEDFKFSTKATLFSLLRKNKK
jgi:hypothetical protein